MKQRQKPLSFSLHPDNHAYIEAVVLKQKETNHRYNRSMYMDDLITHLRTKAEAKTFVTTVEVKKPKDKTELAVVEEPVKRFEPPSPIIVECYMLDRGVHTSMNSKDEAEKFCDHFTSNGWKVGGKAKMKCWKAAVRNWLKNAKEKSGNKDILQNSSDSDWHKQDQGF